MNWLDVLERAGWTALQAAVATITMVPLLTDVAGWEGVAVAAATAAVAALVSFVKTLAQERLGVLETRSEMLEEGH
jgi:hypothetical protein